MYRRTLYYMPLGFFARTQVRTIRLTQSSDRHPHRRNFLFQPWRRAPPRAALRSMLKTLRPTVVMTALSTATSMVTNMPKKMSIMSMQQRSR